VYLGLSIYVPGSDESGREESGLTLPCDWVMVFAQKILLHYSCNLLLQRYIANSCFNIDRSTACPSKWGFVPGSKLPFMWDHKFKWPSSQKTDGLHAKWVFHDTPPNAVLYTQVGFLGRKLKGSWGVHVLPCGPLHAASGVFSHKMVLLLGITHKI